MQTGWWRQLMAVKREADAYYRECADQHCRTNWVLVRPMALLYLGYLVGYYLLVSYGMGNVLQSATILIAIAIHIGITLFIFSFRRNTPGNKIVNIVISCFGYEILGVSAILGVAVFPDEVAFLFPLMLIMMTQIYTRSPLYAAGGNLVFSVAFLICSGLYKSRRVFMLDMVSVGIALGIALVAQVTLMMRSLQYYHSEQALKKMCSLDPMTQLNNKTTFRYLVEEYLHKAHTVHNTACVICDLDNFKGINDKYGHQTGDAVLQAFSAKMHALADADDCILAGRFGGDEFILFYKWANSMDDILNGVRTLLRVEGFPFEVSCCAGIAPLQSIDETFDEVFRRADQSVYEAKSRAHASMVVYHEEINP